MNPTQKDEKIVGEVLKWKLWFAASLMVLCTFVFAKSYEYRPITVSNRTVTAGTAYQPSTTRYTLVTVSAQLSCTSVIIAGASGSVSLQISADNITYITVASISNGISGVLSLTNINGGPLTAVVPATYYYKIVNTTTSGSPTFSILTPAQETSL